MKNPKSLSDSDLLKQTKEVARLEKTYALLLIELLLEVDARKLYATLNCDTLHKYIVKHLGYSDSTANERLRAMRLVREIPEVREKLGEWRDDPLIGSKGRVVSKE